MVEIHNTLPRLSTPEDVVALDIEMFGQQVEKLHRPHGRFACISLKYLNEDFVYQVYEPEQISDVFDRIANAEWVLVNALYDLRQLRRWDTRKFLDSEHKIHDCMLVEQNLFGGYYRDFGMADMARRYWDEKIKKDLYEQFASGEIMTEEMKQYAASDVVNTLKIREYQLKLGRDMTSYWTTDAPMIWVMLDINPVKVLKNEWAEMVQKFLVEATEIEATLGFNTKSYQQTIKELAKENIHITSSKKEILQKYSAKSDVANRTLRTRKLRDAASKYGMRWLESYVEDGDLVYADFKISGALTGRMSCSSPNLQNIPRKDFPQYRELFVPNHDLILAPDVSQQEPRILAYLSNDTNLVNAVKSGESLHVYVARMVYGDDTIVKDGGDYRYGVGKAINLGIGYGLTSKGLSESTGLSEFDSQKIVDKYFNRFPGVKYYMVKYRDFAAKHGYVETVLGRRMYINPYDFKSENNAINSPIQGGAAEFTKLWAINIWRESKRLNIPFPVCMLVHDELVEDSDKEYKDTNIKIIQESMQKTADVLYPGMPFTCEMNEGNSWACHQ